MPPLPQAFVNTLQSDPTAALAALMVIAGRHHELLAFAARTAAAPCEPKPPPRSHSNGGADHRRAKRDRDDEALIEAMRSAPGATIGDWATAIDKSKGSTVTPCTD
jgi:hypothetical protein